MLHFGQDGGGDNGGIAVQGHGARVALRRQLAEPRSVRNHDRPPKRERLEHRKRMRLELAHEHDDVDRGETCSEFLVSVGRDRLDEHAIGNAETRGQLSQLWLVRPPTRNPERRVGTARRMCGNAAITRWCPLYCSSRPTEAI